MATFFYLCHSVTQYSDISHLESSLRSGFAKTISCCGLPTAFCLVSRFAAARSNVSHRILIGGPSVMRPSEPVCAFPIFLPVTQLHGFLWSAGQRLGMGVRNKLKMAQCQKNRIFLYIISNTSHIWHIFSQIFGPVLARIFPI